MKKVIVLLFTAVLCAVLLWGCRMSVRPSVGLSSFRYDHAEQYTGGGAILTDAVERVEIHWLSGSVAVQAHGEDTVSFSEEANRKLTKDDCLYYRLEGTTLLIQFCRSGKWDLNGLEKDLTVLLPEELLLKDLEIDSVSAEIAAFRKGFEESGNTTEVWYLSDSRQWAGAAEAFARNDHILIALPLYVENLPGLLLEFLAGLEPKQTPGTKLAFLLQGGFPEASQSRCCEAYLETLPAQLGCVYGGTLLKGDLFGLSLTDERSRAKLLAPFTEMGRYYAETGYFDKPAVDRFAAPEEMPPSRIRLYDLVFKHVSRLFMGRVAKKLGCRDRLDARPYEACLPATEKP